MERDVTRFKAQAQPKATFCAHCGAWKGTHAWKTLECPTAYRPTTVAEAERELARAEERGDPSAVFVARGNLQQLAGRR